MNSTSNTITLLPIGVPYSTTQNFNVVLTTLGYGNISSVVATSNNLIVVDSAIAYMSATGGTIIDSNGYRTHAFTTSNNLVVSSTGVLNTIDYLVIAGGGGGGGGYQPYNYAGGGGGGAGGLLTGQTAITSTGTSPVTVGGGGAGLKYNATGAGGSGSDTILSISGGSTLTATGGGGGGASANGLSGGSGGGTSSNAGAAGPGTPGQGYPGGVSSPITYGGVPNPAMAGGGGGAAEPGHWNPSDPTASPTSTIAGGNGLSISWAPPAYGTPGPAPGRYFAGGGGGGGAPTGSAYILSGGAGGGGAGGFASAGYPTSAQGQGTLASPGVESGANATINTGGGGGGVGNSGLSSAPPGKSGLGGSGIVLIRYPYVAPPVVNSVTTTASSFIIGSNITFTINTTNANTLTLYYSTNGNVDATNFIGGNTGSFVANTTGGVITLQSNTNLSNPGQFNLQIRQDSTSGYVSGISSNILIVPYTANINATGGDQVIDAGGYRHHIFLSSSTFNVTGVSAAGNVEILAVGGGGAGGPGYGNFTGGGGAGGFLLSNLSIGLNLYTVVVGAGGAASAGRQISLDGSNTAIGTATSGNLLVALGGGGAGYGGGSATPSLLYPTSVGSGGGGAAQGGPGGPGYPGQGYPGGAGNAPNASAGGGGGAGAAGTDGGGVGPGTQGIGGVGRSINWSIPASYGTPGPGPGQWFAGGGSAGAPSNPGYPKAGGAGGGAPYPGSGNGNPGTTNTGGGGSGQQGGPGSYPSLTSTAGGSGIVIIRYPR
jgi:hypothetical protein